mmetsp:Transcript_5500/g.12772  ORF Transcript_5500/g.12772 Transcript_5500/m.12772 type:complete len:229 (-) Transcript_5500:55-741(-)
MARAPRHHRVHPAAGGAAWRLLLRREAERHVPGLAAGLRAYHPRGGHAQPAEARPALRTRVGAEAPAATRARPAHAHQLPLPPHRALRGHWLRGRRQPRCSPHEHPPPRAADDCRPCAQRALQRSQGSAAAAAAARRLPHPTAGQAVLAPPRRGQRQGCPLLRRPRAAVLLGAAGLLRGRWCPPVGGGHTREGKVNAGRLSTGAPSAYSQQGSRAAEGGQRLRPALAV